MKFYSLKNTPSKEFQYNIIFGERSNGKTYNVLTHGMEKFGYEYEVVWRIYAAYYIARKRRDKK